MGAKSIRRLVWLRKRVREWVLLDLPERGFRSILGPSPFLFSEDARRESLFSAKDGGLLCLAVGECVLRNRERGSLQVATPVTPRANPSSNDECYKEKDAAKDGHNDGNHAEVLYVARATGRVE